jgi:ribosomal silencing factor RsfS
MTEWQDTNILQIDISTTNLFVDDQVILSASEDSLQSLLHHMYETTLTDNLFIQL